VVAEELVPWDGTVSRRVAADWLVDGEGGNQAAAAAQSIGGRAKETHRDRSAYHDFMRYAKLSGTSSVSQETRKATITITQKDATLP
jgi:hypothetical protein